MGVSSIAFLPLACHPQLPKQGGLTTRTAAGDLPYSSDTAPFSQTAAFLKLRRSTNTAESY